MYSKFSNQAKGIIARSHRYSIIQNEYVVGTEFLLLSLFNEPNSSCNILLSEQNITEEMIINEINRINVFRKNIPGLIIYTPKFRFILEKALEISKLTNSELIYEEHLFFALLKTTECIGNKVLLNLQLDIDAMISEIIEVMGWNLHEEIETHQFSNFPFIENITDLIKKSKLLPLIGRKEIIERIVNILNKRNKRNVLLIGNAGVGKTAIVEGLAQMYYKEKQNKQVLSLNVTSLLAGTKYRGDFEQRIKDFLDAIKNKDNIIVFIDEIHNIINTGNNDSNLDIANILKPSLARGEINCIGATTINEYYKYIANDSALSRRFLPIFVDEPNIDETIHILNNLKSYFEFYHQVNIPNEIIPYICEQVDKTFVDRFFPDKAIDILDEACSYAKLNNKKELTFNAIDYIIKMINNQQYNEQIANKLKQYPFLKKYFLRYYCNIKESFQPIVTILCLHQNEEQFTNFTKDIAFIFNIRDEAIKRINLSNFTDEYSISNLIGAPPGYIGYDNPNTLTRFVQKYPRSIIVLNNIDLCTSNITQLFSDIFNSGYIEDLASNKIYFTNTIILATTNMHNKAIGFLNLELAPKYQDKLKFNEVINLNHYLNMNKSKEYKTLLEKYQFYFKNNNIDIHFDDYDDLINSIKEDNYHELENILFECMFNSNQRSFSIGYSKKEKQFYIK
ncbi:MAG TPA: AAA family ATPase [Haloplasmataceae bacterium]